jgi:hypothetical protein
MPYVLRWTRYKRARAMVEVGSGLAKIGLKMFDDAGIRGVRTSTRAHTVRRLARAQASAQQLPRYLFSRSRRTRCDWRHLYLVQLALLPHQRLTARRAPPLSASRSQVTGARAPAAGNASSGRTSPTYPCVCAVCAPRSGCCAAFFSHQRRVASPPARAGTHDKHTVAPGARGCAAPETCSAGTCAAISCARAQAAVG